jgi:hypothetical protein
MALVLMPIALALEGVEFFASSHMFLGKPGSELATLGVVTVCAQRERPVWPVTDRHRRFKIVGAAPDNLLL